MAEPLVKHVQRLPDDGPPPRADEFPGCREVRIPHDEIGDYEGRIEYWDARNEAAFIAEPTTTYQEYGAQRLARLVGRIAMRRGSPMDVIGASDLAARDADGELQRLLAADQIVFLNPASTRPRGKEIERSADHLPDVVLEVDYSTDARRRKLGIYESWGFPEVWIEVPDAIWRRRPKNRRPGVTIHLLEGDRYREAAASRAFPTWTAEEIHQALNESKVSSSTVEVLRRVADALAAQEGTGSDDDPLLRRERAEGRAEERLDIMRSAVRDAFKARAVPVTPALESWLDDLGPALDAVVLIRLAWECRDAADFLRRAEESRDTMAGRT